MSMRAKVRERETVRAACERVEALQVQQPWMNGWPRIGPFSVLIGTGAHCVCCGRLQGVTCVAFPEDWEPSGPDPVWPFGEQDCPLCAQARTR